MARYGVKFGIYKNGSFHEQLFPFDAIPRIISAVDFAEIEKGLIQRVNALNMFLRDVNSDKKIIADGVVPENFVYSSTGFLQQCVFITLNSFFRYSDRYSDKIIEAATEFPT